jgi:hypothetical protein
MSHHHDLSQYPISVLWDIENVAIPTASAETALTGSQIVLRMESALADLGLGPIHEFKAFLDIGKGLVKQEMRAELQCSNVMLVDATNVTQTKDLADKMLVVHMFSFALDHPPPATIVLISGDVDFAMPLAALRMRKYHIVLVLPLGRPVNPKLKNIAHKICYFQDILFPEKLYLPVELSRDNASSPAAAPHVAAARVSALHAPSVLGASSDSVALGNLLTPQHLLKSRAELRAERPDLDRQQRAFANRTAAANALAAAAAGGGGPSSRGEERRQARVAANLARGRKCCTHCGKTNHASAQCYFRPSRLSRQQNQPQQHKNSGAAGSPPTHDKLIGGGASAAAGAGSHNNGKSYSSTDYDHHTDDTDDDHHSDDDLIDDDTMWMSLGKGVVTTRYMSDDDDDDDDDHHQRDDVGNLLSPQFIRSSGGAIPDDNVSLLSEPAAEVHVPDLVDTLLDIREGGESRPLVSRIGLELSRKYAFYRSGMATQLIELAAKSGIVILHDKGLRRVELTADGIKRASSLIDDGAVAAAAAPAPPN